MEGRSMTTFYYCSVNHQSGLQSNTFSKLSYIFLMNQNVPQILSLHLRYIYNDFIGQKILKLFSRGWASHITSICSWTFRLPWLCTTNFCQSLYLKKFWLIIARSKILKSQLKISLDQNCGDFISYLATLCRAYFQWDRCKPLPLHVGYHCNRHIPLYRHISVNACPCLITPIISG